MIYEQTWLISNCTYLLLRYVVFLQNLGVLSQHFNYYHTCSISFLSLFMLIVVFSFLLWRPSQREVQATLTMPFSFLSFFFSKKYTALHSKIIMMGTKHLIFT